MNRSRSSLFLFALTIALGTTIGCRNRAAKEAPPETGPEKRESVVQPQAASGATAQGDAPSPIAEKDAAGTTEEKKASPKKPKTLAASGNHTCALKDGGVFCWGENGFGELGGGTVGEASTKPIRVEGLRDVVALAGGRFHSCALFENGTVSCWGRNDAGQLGSGAKEWQSTKPMPVKGLRDVVMIAAGVAHTCAALQDGTAVCWGDNQFGRLGNGSSGSHAKEPVPVSNLRDVVELAAGMNHTCARHANGTVSCWGGNEFGQLGDGTSGKDAGKLVPTPVPGLKQVVGIAAGLNHSCARHSNGTVSCWGYDYSGQLGGGVAGETTGTPKPTAIRDLRDVVELAAGQAHTCARVADGDVFCWGSNFSGQIGDGSEDFADKPYPTPVLGVDGAVEISAGDNHACARIEDGRRVCWGENEAGQLGDGKTESSSHAGLVEW